MPTEKDSNGSQTAPLTAYDHFNPDLIKKIERSIRAELGAKTEAVILEAGAPISIFRHTDQGLVCINCGARALGDDPQACSECGASHNITLVLGYK